MLNLPVKEALQKKSSIKTRVNVFVISLTQHAHSCLQQLRFLIPELVLAHVIRRKNLVKTLHYLCLTTLRVNAFAISPRIRALRATILMQPPVHAIAFYLRQFARIVILQPLSLTTKLVHVIPSSEAQILA